MGLPRPQRAPPQTPGPAPEDTGPAARFVPRTAHTDADALPATDAAPGKTARRRGPPKGALATLVFVTGLSYAFGWYAAFNGVIPGVFLAADIGIMVLALMLLRTAGRTINERVHDPVLAKASGALPKAAGSALAVFAFFLNFTNVLQMAIGVGAGILAFQYFVSRSRLGRVGHTRMGPGVPLAITGAGVYLAWRAARAVLGPLPGFELVSLGYALVATFVYLRMTTRLAHEANGLRRDPQAAATAQQPRATGTPKVVVALVVGYLVFRVFISTAIPYGPVIEWILVCLGALFFAIFAADRIGTVPTRRSLPAADVRTHVQRVTNLPDRRLAQTQEHMQRFVDTGRDVDWVIDRLDALLQDAGADTLQRDEALAPLRGDPERPMRRDAMLRSMSRHDRARLVARVVELVRLLQRPTGTLKTNGTVRRDRGRRPQEPASPTPSTAPPAPPVGLRRPAPGAPGASA